MFGSKKPQEELKYTCGGGCGTKLADRGVCNTCAARIKREEAARKIAVAQRAAAEAAAAEQAEADRIARERRKANRRLW